MRRLRERRKAAGLRAITQWQAAAIDAPFSAHRMHDARSLAMHVLIVRRIEQTPALMKKAHANLDRWAKARQGPLPRWLPEWLQILKLPWPEVAARITALTEDGARLRQSSPFAGVLSPAERTRVYAAFRA
jgi:hypothetical protein